MDWVIFVNFVCVWVAVASIHCRFSIQSKRQDVLSQRIDLAMRLLHDITGVRDREAWLQEFIGYEPETTKKHLWEYILTATIAVPVTLWLLIYWCYRRFLAIFKG